MEKTKSKTPTKTPSKAEKLKIFEEIKEKRAEVRKEKFKKFLPFIIIGAFLIFGVFMFFFLPVNKIVSFARTKSVQIKRELVLKQEIRKAPSLPTRIRETAPIETIKDIPNVSAAPVKKRVSITDLLDKILDYCQKFIGVGSAGVALYLSFRKVKEEKKKRKATT